MVSFAPDMLEVRRLYEDEGLGVKSIVRKTGISFSRVREFLAEEGESRAPIKRPAMTPEEALAAVESYRKGESIHAIAKRTKHSYHTIKHHLIAHNVPRRRSNYTIDFSGEQQEDIIRRYQNLDSIQAIAQSYGCSHKPIAKLLTRRGIVLRDDCGAKKRQDRNHCLPLTVFACRKEGARKKGIAWDLSIADVDRLFSQQKGLCYYTKLPLANTGDPHIYSAIIKDDPLSLSIDRLDSKHGYLIGNVALCCKFINLAKNSYPEQVFKDALCKAAVAICEDLESQKANALLNP